MRIAELLLAPPRLEHPAAQLPLVIAEVGVNHEGSLDLARRQIALAAEAGADAVKFQSYKAKTLASVHSPAYWDTTREPTSSQYELFERHDKFWKNEFEALKRTCDEHGVEFLSTPFDLESADFLDPLMDAYKIASADITNLPFVRHLAAKGKPILLSTGAAELFEIEEAIGWIGQTAPAPPVALLHCVLNYPTLEDAANLGMIAGLAARYPGRVIGYSDHVPPGDMRVLETAWLLGARILEKHFTHDKTRPGNDHYHAMDATDLRRFRDNVARARTMLGDFTVRALPSEAPARLHARRSLVAARAIPKGKALEAADLTWKRPGHGISPREHDAVIGLAARRDIAEDTPLTWGMLEEG
jgi:N-acetylneuraminate synthase